MELRTSREHRIENPGPTPLARPCGLLHAIAYDAKIMRPRRPSLGTRLLIASSLLFGMFMCYLTAFIAVDRGRLTVISVQRYAPEYGNTDDAAWPCRVEMEWPAKPNRVATSSGWGLRWIEWANDDVPGADSVLRVARMSDFSITNPTLDPPMQPLHALQIESIVELRASWPFPCLAWSDSAAVLAAQSTVPTPSPRHVWMCRGWAAPTSPLATYLGYSGTVPRLMPLAPRPFAFALNSTIWAAAFFAMASAIRWGLPPARRARRRRFNLCEHCAYPRDTFARCPECGTVHQT